MKNRGESYRMPKLAAAVVLLCASLASAGVLTRSNDVFTSFDADEKGKSHSKPDIVLESQSTKSFETTGLIPPLKSTTFDSPPDSSNETEEIKRPKTILNETEETKRPLKTILNETEEIKMPLKTILNETEEIKMPLKTILNETEEIKMPLKTILNETEEIKKPLKTILNETEETERPKTILNDTEGMNWPLNVFPNETNSLEFDSNENLHSAVKGQTEPTNGEVAQILAESFSNDSAAIDEYDIENNSSSFEQGSLNETEFIGIGNFSLNVTEETKISESGSLFTNSNPGVESKNLELNPQANFSDSEQNSSSVVVQNEASINAHEPSFELSETEGIDVSLGNQTDMNVTSLNLFNTSEEISNEDLFNDFIPSEVNNPNSSLEESKPGIEEAGRQREGMFSNFGFDFLKNTQLAKNAVKAMEIFNLSDSITDHIIEENEFHSFLDTAANETSSHLLNMVAPSNDTVLSANDSTVEDSVVPKCPPPGVCIFWFLAQDTCAVNSHCLGSRICCKIRCSKTCIEV